MSENKTKFTSVEKKVTIGISGIFFLRMLGLFLVLPVIVYAYDMEGATFFLVGITMGIYGLTQAFFQIPYGLWSDKFGRMPILIIGSISFFIGSAVAAYASYIGNIYVLIVGRVLQGTGAASSVAMAFIADMTREEVRTRSMASIGAGIGMAFPTGMILGPLLYSKFGLGGVFGLTAILTLISILYIIFWLPRPKKEEHHTDAEFTGSYLKDVLKNKNLLRMDFGVFVLHAVLTAVFIVIPFRLKESIPASELWQIYLLMSIVGLAIMVPSVIIAEKKNRIKEIKILGILILLISFGLMFITNSVTMNVVSIIVFFTGFLMLEPILPSLMTKFSNPKTKGTASGLFNTSLFLGAFVGGIGGGALLHISENLIIALMSVLTLVWLLVVFSMQIPKKR